MKKIIFFIFFICINYCLLAQYEKNGIQYIDKITLKRGAVFLGKIIDYVPDSHILFEMTTGKTLRFDMKFVEKTEQQCVSCSVRSRAPRTYAFPEKGIYNVTTISFQGGARPNSYFTPAFGLQHTTGYQWNRWIGTGLGLAVDSYDLDGYTRPILPIYAEARGYFFAKNVSPYYSAAAGYSVAFKNESQGIVQAQGSWYAHPAIGIRIGGSAHANFLADVGMKFQKARFTTNGWQAGDKNEYDYLFKRMTFRVGLIF
jgi:hypothetical protein